MLCKQCGQPIEEGRKFCFSCGAPVSDANQQSASPAPYSSGGLIAWSIILLFLSTIPGIVALIFACGINNAATAEAQRRKISTCKIWCIVGTALGALQVLALLLTYLSL